MNNPEKINTNNEQPRKIKLGSRINTIRKTLEAKSNPNKSNT